MLKTLKVATSDLDIGMYVSSLDRSWLETPFLTQGFFIESQEEIAQLREYCEFVYVDSRRSSKKLGGAGRQTLEKSDREARRQSAKFRKSRPGKPNKDRPRIPLDQIFVGRALKPYDDSCGWEEEHPRAQQALNTLIGDIDQIYTQVVKGDKLNIVKLRKSVEPLVDTISSNPDACLWVSRLKQHDRYTYQHSLGAAILAVSVGRQMGLQRHDLRSLAMGCMLMDIGKLRLDPELLQSESDLNDEEMAEVASHVEHGLEILDECGVINQDVIDIVAHHHERYDGSGYPEGLYGSNIPPFARVAAIVDTYDAITSDRHYAAAMSPTDAIKTLYSARDEDFQAELVEAFIQAVGIYPAGTLVELTTGEVGVVVAEYRTRRLRPKILLLLNEKKERLPRTRVVDLQKETAPGEQFEVKIARSLEPEAFGIDLSQVGAPKSLPTG